MQSPSGASFFSLARNANGFRVLLLASTFLGAGLLHAADGQPKDTDQGPPPDMPQGGPGEGGPGGPGGGPGGPPPGFGAHKAYVLKGLYELSSGTKAESNLKLSPDKTDLSAVYVKGSGKLSLSAPAIFSSGDTSSEENSSFYGLNAAILAGAGGRISIEGGKLVSTGSGSNLVIATGAKSYVSLREVELSATGLAAHGVMATAGGFIELTDVTISTTGAHGAPVATDRGGGTVLVTGGRFTATGEGSPGLYSTGDIRVTGGLFDIPGSEAAVIEGSNCIEVTDTTLVAGRRNGVMVYQSFSGDAEGREGRFSMRGGSLSAAEGALFYVTNTHATIRLSGAALSAKSGVLLNAAAGRWGRKGDNGGHVTLYCEGQSLRGDLLCDKASSLKLSLQKGSSLSGRVEGGALMLDETSRWSLTADSSITTLQLAKPDTEGLLAVLEGNGHDLRYDAKAPLNKWLGGRTISLPKGGRLLPR